MKKVVSIVVVALFVAAAAQADTVRPGAKKSTQKIDAAVANGLLTAIYKANKEQHQEVLYADNNTSNKGQQVSQHELNKRAGAFLDACDKGHRPAPQKRKAKAKPAAPAKTPEQIRAEKAAKQKEAERKKLEKEAFWQMYYEALANISRAGK